MSDTREMRLRLGSFALAFRTGGVPPSRFGEAAEVVSWACDQLDALLRPQEPVGWLWRRRTRRTDQHPWKWHFTTEKPWRGPSTTEEYEARLVYLSPPTDRDREVMELLLDDAQSRDAVREEMGTEWLARVHAILASLKGGDADEGGLQGVTVHNIPGPGLHANRLGVWLSPEAWASIAPPTDRDREAIPGKVCYLYKTEGSDHIQLDREAGIMLKPGTKVTVLIPADAILASKEES